MVSEMPRCETCRHWDRFGDTPNGTCEAWHDDERIDLDGFGHGVQINYPAVRFDFGCIAHQPKEE